MQKMLDLRAGYISSNFLKAALYQKGMPLISLLLILLRVIFTVTALLQKPAHEKV